MQLHFQRYQQIIQVPVDETCICTVTTYTETLIKQTTTLWKDFLLIKDTVTGLTKEADKPYSQFLDFLQSFFNSYEEIKEIISSQTNLDELIQLIKTISDIMVLLLPFVSKHSSHPECM